MTTKYNANYIETLPFSDLCEQIALTINTNLGVTVPGITGQQFQAFFEYASESNVFVRLNSTASVPSVGTSANQQYNEFKPRKRYVHAGDVINLITPDTAAYVGISFRQIQG